MIATLTPAQLMECVTIPFEFTTYEVSGNTVSVSTDIDGQPVKVTATITADDTAESIEDKLIQDLQDWEQHIAFANSTYCDFFAEHGYN